jgi:SAM-dependent methyltransferase
MAALDPASRFDGRVDDYVRGRPAYPESLFDALIELAGLAPGDAVADIGSGTGVASAPLLRRGVRVFAVEPNVAMRTAAVRWLGGDPGFASVAGSAEATGLADGSVDLVLAAQAFHWFDAGRARTEWRRILRPPCRVALVWNARRAGGTPFLAAYEALLLRFGTDYREVGHRGVGRARLAAFFGAEPEHLRFENAQELDEAGLRARLLSSSYIPAAGQDGHDEMLAALAALFAAHQAEGRVRIEYDVDCFLGRLV